MRPAPSEARQFGRRFSRPSDRATRLGAARRGCGTGPAAAAKTPAPPAGHVEVCCAGSPHGAMASWSSHVERRRHHIIRPPKGTVSKGLVILVRAFHPVRLRFEYAL
jgi:hypothetical protein